MGVASMFIASSSSIADGAVVESKLALEAVSAAKMKKEGTATHVLTSNGAGAIPSYQAPALGNPGSGSPICIPCVLPQTAVSGTWIHAIGNTYTFCGYMYVNVPAINDEFTYSVYMAAGTYTIKTITSKSTDHGICSVYIDGGGAVGTMDYYNGGGLTKDNVSEITGINVAASGIKVVSFKMASKNGGSSGYNVFMSGIEIVRTA